MVLILRDYIKILRFLVIRGEGAGGGGGGGGFVLVFCRLTTLMTVFDF